MLDDDMFRHFTIASLQLLEQGALKPMQYAELMCLAHRDTTRCVTTDLDVLDEIREAGLGDYVVSASIHQYFISADSAFAIGPVEINPDKPILAAIKATKPDGSNLLTGDIPQHLAPRILEIIEAAAEAAGIKMTDADSSYLRHDGMGNIDIVSGGVTRAFNGATQKAIEQQVSSYLQEMKDNPFFASIAPPDDWGSPDPGTRKENPNAPDQ